MSPRVMLFCSVCVFQSAIESSTSSWSVRRTHGAMSSRFLTDAPRPAAAAAAPEGDSCMNVLNCTLHRRRRIAVIWFSRFDFGIGGVKLVASQHNLLTAFRCAN